MESNNLYPIFLKLNKVKTLIVGGGKVGYEKVQFILRQSPEAKIKVVSEQFHPQIIRIAIENKNVQIAERKFVEEDLNGVGLAILATNNKEVNKSIQELANRHNVLSNTVDRPESCDFYTAAALTKGNLKVAVSSNGGSPTLAKRLRDIFDEVLPEETEISVQQLHNIREKLKGDLENKVRVLNQITEVLVQKNISESIIHKKLVTDNINLN